MTRDELVTLHARQEAEKVLATLLGEPEWLIAQRREDLLDDVLRLSRRQRRDRIRRDHERRTA